MVDGAGDGAAGDARERGVRVARGALREVFRRKEQRGVEGGARARVDTGLER